MIHMDQGWAAVIAAGATGAFTLGGVAFGLVVGRRQTTDQATVEHGHWLRGQRLEAYTDVLTTWDEVIADLRSFQKRWNEEVESLQEIGYTIHPSVIVGQKTDEAWTTLRPCLERADLLGPSALTEALDGLVDAFGALVQVLENQASQEPYSALEELWDEAMERSELTRAGFHIDIATALRTPPSPRGEPPL